MRSVSRSLWRSVEKVAGVIELLIVCHPQGFSVLLGEVEPPTAEEVHIMLNSIREKKPADFIPVNKNLTTEAERIIWDYDYFNEIIKLAQGWPHINIISREFKEAETRLWNIVIDHIRFVGSKNSRYLSKLGYVAARYKVAPRTVIKYRREFSQKLANAILMPPAEGDNFYLLSC